MKRILYIAMVFAFALVFLLGCYAQGDTQEAANTPQATIIPITTDEESAETVITLIVPYFYSGSYSANEAEQSSTYLIELFNENGFTVEIDTVNCNLDSPSCYDDYFSYLANNMNNDNTLAFVSGYKMSSLSSYIGLADLSEQIKSDAPNYNAYAERNQIISTSNDTAIVSYLSDLDNVSVALIYNSILAEYSKPIETSDDYLKFVAWAEDENESLHPSVILTFHDDITSRSNLLYDLFVPLQGFIPLGSYLDNTYTLCVDKKNPENVYDTSKLSFYEAMLENIEIHANYHKITVKHENNAIKNFSGYSSILMPLGDMSFYSSIVDYNFYPPNYTMEILNPSMFLERQHENMYITAAESTDQKEALRLIDWIYSDINNYILVKYGEAGVNYSFDEYENIVLTEAGQQYVENCLITSIIKNIEFDSSLNSLPANFLEELNSIEYVKDDNFANQYENYQKLITTDNYIYDALNRFTRRWESSIRILELTTERKVNYEPGTFTFDEIDDLIAVIAN